VLRNSIARFAVVQKGFGGTQVYRENAYRDYVACDKASVLTVPSQRCGMAEKKGTQALSQEEEADG
jgi:hypothetical protein